MFNKTREHFTGKLGHSHRLKNSSKRAVQKCASTSAETHSLVGMSMETAAMPRAYIFKLEEWKNEQVVMWLVGRCVCLFVRLLVCLFVCLVFVCWACSPQFVCLLVYFFVCFCLSVCLPLSLSLFVSLSLSLSLSLSIYLSIFLSVCLSVCSPF